MNEVVCAKNRHPLIMACVALMLAMAGLRPAAALPEASPAHSICDDAARIASGQESVPLDVLRAVTRTETGRSTQSGLLPWPWTVNMEGAGRWFASQDEARAYVFQHFKQGARSFDVGCFQINYKWHGTAFRSIDEMFDPVQNAIYAARFLRSLYDELGDWTAAAGAFHSRTPEYARRYEAKFNEIHADLSDSPVRSETARAERSEPVSRALDLGPSGARRPLIGDGLAARGSLVPLGNQRADTRAFLVLVQD